MAIKPSKALFLVLSLLLVSSTLALSSRREEVQRRRELEQCKQECRQQPHYDQGMQQQCERRCEQQQQQQQEETDPRRQDPERRLEQCKQSCREQGPQQRRQCESQCQQQYEQERRQQEQERDSHRQDPKRRLEECKQECQQRHQGQQQERWECERRCQQQYEQERQGKDEINPQREEEQEERAGSNPYVFESESFRHLVRSEHGNIRVLQNFAKKSPLLLGIANYRLAILEANPNTFVVPNHRDAETVCYVMKGEGTVTLIKQDRDRESHNIRQGDILKVSAGTVIYVINRSNNEKLLVAKILQPVSTPGQVEEFYTVGGDEPESYYRVFSTEILEAALNTRRDQLERLFGQQRQGVIIKASQEQIRSMSQHSSSSEHGHWPFGGESKGPFNLLDKRPTHSNQHGRLHEADCNDYQPLSDLNIQVALANITGGSMTLPYYNSKATKISIVTDGRGYFEMVCPHLGQQGGGGQWGEREEGQQGRYQKVRARISRNTVFIAPAGHPLAVVADKGQNLEVFCFEVNAEGNRRTFVAGKDNVVSKMEKEAKELAFGVPSKLVDEVFGRGKEEMFVRGPEPEREEEEGRRPLESILEFAGF